MVIYKYRVNPNGTVEMPEDAQILSIHTQNKEPFIWALVDAKSSTVLWNFVLVGTGHEFDPAGLSYVGSFHEVGGWMVYHLFQRKDGM